MFIFSSFFEKKLTNELFLDSKDQNKKVIMFFLQHTYYTVYIVPYSKLEISEVIKEVAQIKSQSNALHRISTGNV